jgi:GDPmannose 4,6-dehydratase
VSGLSSSRHVRLCWTQPGGTRQDPVRPDPLAEVDVLLGDASKAKKVLSWSAETSLEAMVTEMVEADLARHHARTAS